MYTEANLSEQIIEAASWRVAAALMRMYPDLRLLETHPGGGQYDCLSLLAPDRDPSHGHIDLNRRGNAHVHQRFDSPATGSAGEEEFWSWIGFWPEALSSTVRGVTERLADAAGLPPVQKLPPTSDEVLIYRVFSAVLTATAFDSVPWSARMGYADTSGYGGGLREYLFEPFDHMARRVLMQEPDDPYGESGFRFWFLLKDDEPVAAFERDGSAELLGGEVASLRSMYKASSRRVWPVAFDLVGSVLP